MQNVEFYDNASYNNGGEGFVIYGREKSDVRNISIRNNLIEGYLKAQLMAHRQRILTALPGHKAAGLILEPLNINRKVYNLSKSRGDEL
jgi:hypothetical protein